MATVTVLTAAGWARGQLGRTTPMFVCGEDERLPDAIPLRWETVVLAGDGRLYSPCPDPPLPGRPVPQVIHPINHREMRERTLLSLAERSPDPELRRLAMLAYGRLNKTELVFLPFIFLRYTRGNVGMASAWPAGPDDSNLTPGPLVHALDDPVPQVRLTAAGLIADALSGVAVQPNDRDVVPPTPGQIKAARIRLETLLKTERDDNVAEAVLEALGRLPYADDVTRTEIELEIDIFAAGRPTRLLGAVKGLESLIYANPRRPVADVTRQKLREWAVIGPTLTPVPTIAGEGTAFKAGDEDTLARVRRLALTSLQEIDDDDTQVLERAAHDADWQVRRLVAARMDLRRPEFATAYALLAVDPAFQVRYELVGAVSRFATSTHDCRELLKLMSDPSPLVEMRAIDELPDECADAAPIVARLTALAEQLRDAASGQTWHVPTRAWIALSRLSPPRARPLLEALTAHDEWPVRMTAATAAGLLADGATLEKLADDRDPNVRTAVLQALARMKSPALTATAIRALEADDYQLVLMAATALKGVSDADREDAIHALVASLQRLTRKAADTSRDTRVGIIARLREIILSLPLSVRPQFAPELFAPRADFDLAVRTAARAAVSALVSDAAPPWPSPQHRYPLQPTIDQFQQLPKEAKIKITGGGAIEMVFLPSEAPVTIARFVELVRAGYYNGLTFHRVVPNFLIQGGSPGANGYMGTPRYWRDEVGLEPHTRGAVGLSTHGRDTGDGQFFIDLVDLPRLDHDYTVFARVTAGLDVIDGIMEGARIESIALK